MIIETFDSKQTYELGYKLGCEAKAGDIYCLDGELGVGKTVFTQGFAKGLGIEEPINSPTFTIVQEYTQGRIPLYHFDVYRISDVSEMDEIGYEEYFYSDGVCLVEWGKLIDELFPDNTTYISISKDLSKGFDYRKVEVATVMDARRAHLYSGLYRFENGKLITVHEQCLISYGELAGILNEVKEKVVFVGDGIAAAKDYFKDNLTCNYTFSPAGLRTQRASSVALAAIDMANEGKTIGSDMLKPDYLRPSQAEREHSGKRA